jgi:tryptophan-rich sensory protein
MLVCLLIGTFAVAAIGGWLTIPSIPDWYAGLVKPGFNPPNNLFGPVWSLLYLMMSIAAWLAWRSASDHERNRVLLIYAGQLAVNLFWSALFFALHLTLAALADCLALLVLIIWMSLFFRRFSRTAGLLLLPYVIWVAFACFLNGAIVLLN